MQQQRHCSLQRRVAQAPVVWFGSRHIPSLGTKLSIALSYKVTFRCESSRISYQTSSELVSADSAENVGVLLQDFWRVHKNQALFLAHTIN